MFDRIFDLIRFHIWPFVTWKNIERTGRKSCYTCFFPLLNLPLLFTLYNRSRFDCVIIKTIESFLSLQSTAFGKKKQQLKYCRLHSNYFGSAICLINYNFVTAFFLSFVERIRLSINSELIGLWTKLSIPNNF